MNLILDLDGTLVEERDTLERTQPAARRPFLTEFLAWALDTFAHVSIWSAADPKWVALNVNSWPERDRFHFVWAGVCLKHVVKRNRQTGKVESVLRKKLVKVFRKWPDVYTAQNTRIVDNTPETFGNNRAQGVPIDTYEGQPHDRALLELKDRLRRELFTNSQPSTDAPFECTQLEASPVATHLHCPSAGTSTQPLAGSSLH